MTVAFDIDVFDTADTAELTMVHPVTGTPTTWVWTLAGPGHPRTIEQSNRIARERLDQERQKEQARVNGKKWHEPRREPEEERRRNCAYFAERVVDWTPCRINGEDYPFTTENCIAILADPRKPRIFNQLATYFAGDEAFTASSATS